jgi:hypothetical protein
MKIITSVTAFQDAVGMRMSATYSEIDDETGRIISDNKRFDRVITDAEAKANARALLEYAGDNIPE